MKKNLKFVLFALIVVSMFGLASCDFLNPNKLVGTWSVSYTDATYGAMTESITFAKDKTYSMGVTMLGLTISVPGTYEYTSTTITTTPNDTTAGTAVTFDYTISGAELTLTSEGVSQIYTKQ